MYADRPSDLPYTGTDLAGEEGVEVGGRFAWIARRRGHRWSGDAVDAEGAPVIGVCRESDEIPPVHRVHEVQRLEQSWAGQAGVPLVDAGDLPTLAAGLGQEQQGLDRQICS
jgi:hypothetical protein